MRNLFISIFVFVLFPLNTFCQEINLEKAAKEITEEGKLLYRLEMASWYGTDIFLDSFQEKERIGGYFSYLDKDTPKCLFFSRGENPQVIGVVSFGDIKIVETATIDFKERDFKENERSLYTIRKKALTEIQQDSVLFKTYTNANLNLIPYIGKEGKKVYVLTGPKVMGTVLFGNDYLLTFDDRDNLLSKKEIHRNLIPIKFEKGQNMVASMHSHAPETGNFITSTDICTLMLYAKFAEWKEHIVISKDYVSIWDCVNESLTLISMEDYETMKK
ncbi:MAG: hypothetical protein LBN74_02530 [Prevotella sp.]|jgi:hypothetical protein|nr:hypothetical protein [Prevotella sp.]